MFASAQFYKHLSCLIVVVSLCGRGRAQNLEEIPFVDDSSEKNYQHLNQIEMTIGLRDGQAFASEWPEVFERAEKNSRFAGRLLLRKFSADKWSSVSSIEESPLEPDQLNKVKAEATYFVDFLADHIKQQFRFDYCSVPENDVADLVELQSSEGQLTIPLFELFSHPAITERQLFGLTPDYEITTSRSTIAKVSRPKKSGRGFPRIVDLRTLGMFSFEQWQAPTSLESWKIAITQFSPVAIERVDEEHVIFHFANQPYLRTYVVNIKLNRIVEYVERPIAAKDDRFLSISVFDCKSDHVKISYDEGGDPASFVIGSFQNIWTGHFINLRSTTEKDDRALKPKSFTSENVRLEIDRAILNEVELLLELGLAPQLGEVHATI